MSLTSPAVCMSDRKRFSRPAPALAAADLSNPAGVIYTVYLVASDTAMTVIALYARTAGRGPAAAAGATGDHLPGQPVAAGLPELHHDCRPEAPRPALAQAPELHHDGVAGPVCFLLPASLRQHPCTT